MVLPELTAPSLALPQLPPTARVPASSLDTVTSGVLSLPGVATALTSAATGAVVSKVRLNAEEAEETLPAVSVAVAVRLWLPTVKALPGVKLQLPEPSAVTVPKVPSTLEITVTVALASEVPVRVGVVSLVMLSVFELPLSLAALKSGVVGADGALVSTVTANTEDADEALPATSVAVAVTLWLPAAMVEAVMLQLPEPSEVVEPKLPSILELKLTLTLASAVPLKVGVVSLVLLSVSELPVSLPASISGVPGADGAVVSIVMARADEADEVLPAASVAVEVIE